MTVLDRIVAEKRGEVLKLRAATPRSSFPDSPLFHLPVRSLSAALVPGSAPRIIAEVKRASPAAGEINGRIDPPAVAKAYRDAGAAAVSVLTDRKFFSGAPEDLSGIRPGFELPLLRKDFIVDEIQIPESRSLGADAILLIAAVLDPGQIAEYQAGARELGMDALVEVHDERDLAKLDLDTVALVGVNNRNLSDFTIDLETTARLRRLIPPGTVVVSESGLRSAADARRVLAAGADAILVGEHLMRSPDPGARLAELIDALRQD